MRPIPTPSSRLGNAEIRVDADFAGSLFGDIAKAGAGTLGGDAEAPVAKVHPLGIRHMKDEFSNYQEREAKSFQSKGFGEGGRSIFIADQALGGKTYGYRATLLSGDRRITVITHVPRHQLAGAQTRLRQGHCEPPSGRELAGRCCLGTLCGNRAAHEVKWTLALFISREETIIS